MEYRNKYHKKFNFHDRKVCIIKSLHEINCFLTKINAVHKINDFKKILIKK